MKGTERKFMANTGYSGKHSLAAGPRKSGFIILILIFVFGGAAGIIIHQLLTSGENVYEKAYAAGMHSEIRLFRQGEDCLEKAASVVRGEQVEASVKTEAMTADFSKNDIPELREDEFRRIRTEEGEEFYVRAANLASAPNECVLEKEMYVRTPATVYSKDEGAGIASFAPKGTELAVTGFDYLDEKGNVNKYRVSFKSGKGDEEKLCEGYIYAKYLVSDLKSAKVVYNKHGEHDKAAKAVYGFELYGGKAAGLDYYPYERTEIEGNEFCTNARAVYLNSAAAVNYKQYLKLIRKTGCDAVVVDIKDGPLAYRSEIAKKLSPESYRNAYTSQEKYGEAVAAYKDAGLYVIGRIVTFNDPYYAKDHPEDCIRYKGSKGWPSAFSRDVWEYNVKLAREAVRKFGFNEIQFDYVRFPEASYDMSKSGKADFRNEYDEEKGQAVQNFCFYAADQLRDAGAYISVDVFGESAYGYMTAYGQYWPGISNIVDAISAMPYTDHIGGSEPWAHPYQTMLTWSKRAAAQQKILSDPAEARTWITGYDTPYWAPEVVYNEKRMKAQIRALKDSGLGGGFIPWNGLSDISKYNSYKGIWGAPEKQ